MEEKKTEGLLLQTFAHLSHQKILKVLTKDEGLCSFFAKKKDLALLADPFLEAEWVYSSGKSEIHPLKDISPKNSFDFLRTSFPHLEVAGKIAQAILKTQAPGKKSPAMYALSLSFFKKLPEFAHPETLLASFYLKTLLHEGFLDPEENSPSYSQSSFSSEEQKLLHLLVFTRKFQILRELKSSREFQGKVERLFSDLVSH